MKYLIFFVLYTTSIVAQHPLLKHRESLDLLEWKFKKGIIYNAQSSTFNDSNWESVSIPHTYSMDAINDVGYYRGVAWYRTTQKISESMKGKRIYLRFEGVGQEAEIYVNNKRVEKHIGGYAAFCVEITEHTKIGLENNIVVKVTNEPNFKRIPVNDKLFNHYGGIYRPVQLFATENTNIKPDYFGSSGAFITLKEHNTSNANIEVRTHLSSIKKTPTILLLNLKDKTGKTVNNKKLKLTGFSKDTVIVTNISIPTPHYWQAKTNPYLYTAEISVSNGNSTDLIEQSFGLKSFIVDPNNGFVLNNEPYRLYGVCMHQEWKQVGPSLTAQYHQKDMNMVEEIGATAVRLSHYQHSDLTYQLADEKGLLVWAEIPFVHDYSGREGENAKQQLKELILQNYNHPSIYVWGLWNEVRAYDSPEEACVILTKELNDLAHLLDPTRLTTSASDRGMESNMGNISDLQAWNKYYGWYYGEYPDMGKWLDDYHQKYPERPVGISEYGIGGNIFQQDITKLEKPSGNYFPEPEQTKYHEITWNILKDRPFIWSSFIWNMFDFSVAGWNRGGTPNLNHKGLVTFDRSTKKDAFYFYKANWSKKPTLHISNKRMHQNNGEINEIKVFTNLSKITLYINDRKIKTIKNTSNTVLFKNIQLVKGQNHISIQGTLNGVIIKDSLTTTTKPQ